MGWDGMGIGSDWDGRVEYAQRTKELTSPIGKLCLALLANWRNAASHYEEHPCQLLASPDDYLPLFIHALLADAMGEATDEAPPDS